MEYNEIAKACEGLGYMDKFCLAHFLIQLARKEEEIQNPQSRAIADKSERCKKNAAPDEANSIEYIMERIGKLRPNKKKTLLNSIYAMYQFQGGVSEADQEAIIAELQQRKFLKVDADGKVVYLR